jgi:hypothetical protein
MKTSLIAAVAMSVVLSMNGQTDSPLKPALSSLAYFQGGWSCDGHFFKVDRKISADLTFRSDLNGAWLVLRHDDRPPNQFHAMEFWGFDEAAKQYVAVITDSGGGLRWFTSPGWTEDRLVWTGDNLSFRQNATQRFTFVKKNAREFVMTYAAVRGEGEWTSVDTLTCSRK